MISYIRRAARGGAAASADFPGNLVTVSQPIDDPSAAVPASPPPKAADPFAPPPPAGQAPYGPGAHGWPPGAAGRPAAKPMSRLAVTSLTLGVLGFVPPLSVLSMGFSIGAFSRISRRGQRGFGLAAAGLVLSWFWLVNAVVVVVILAFLLQDLSAGPERGPDGRPKYAGKAGPWYLKEGDCAADYAGTWNDDALSDYQVVPCDQPHRYEVFAVVRIPGGRSYPGDATVGDAANRLCTARQSATERPPGAMVGTTYPSVGTWWLNGDHEALCYYSAAIPWTGPAKPATPTGSPTTV
ncbi:DUF4190 domain-containing protein [Kitasatospora sp. NPDC047058]|uniref:DUF4190 domain-containing protein n=1 Tax=Kitasatospora sp. NPDC047058 TaxID=3155620 RepID=UPI003400956A